MDTHLTDAVFNDLKIMLTRNFFKASCVHFMSVVLVTTKLER